MTERYDVISFRKTKNDKVFVVRLGSASPREGGGFNCWLDAMPVPGPSGSYEIQIMPPRDKGEKPAKQVHGDIDDGRDLPF